MNSVMSQTVKSYIAQHNMLREKARVVVGLSGGADSVALLLVMRDLGYTVYAVHCNFHLRGDESKRDERFVTELCQRLNVPLDVKHFDTRMYARLHHISIEMAARDLRYKYFEKVRAELEYKAIAVAHHKDDQAETLLLNIIRGTGIRGLTGMHPANGHIIRPLLCVTRKEILRYLEDKHQEYITDSTNKERDALRNRVRLDLIPMLKEDFNPQIVDMLGRLCENMQESIVAYKYGVEKQFQEYDVHEHRLRLNVKPKDPNLPVILHEWLQGKGFTRSQEKQMQTSKGESGRHWTSGTHVVFCDKNTLTLLPIDFAPEPPRLKQETVEKIEDTSPNVAYFDADELTYPLTIRLVQPGDKMLPFGEHASREIRAILKKTPLSQVARKYAWVVCHGSEIIWLVGVRATNHYRVSYKTKNIIKLSVSDPGFLPDGLKTYVD
ncbi:MAG: tRNA lysidine(34) synthetase TilS [Bacteroidaceae bacterium]|nr:tRNA lysidine(34) synthetase TilS [Bacteroidaceae bacterium]